LAEGTSKASNRASVTPLAILRVFGVAVVFPSTVVRNLSSASPSKSVRLCTLAIIRGESPSIRTEGTFSSTKNSFRVTTFAALCPAKVSGVTPFTVSRHSVAVSGALKVKEALPSASVTMEGFQ
jgi:hypothetical protein